jgi:ubiquitin C-terminal hydrolase
VELQKVVRSAFSQFRRGTQEDAHEFFRTVVDGVDEEHKKKDSFVRELFHLNTTSVVTCHGCQTSFARLEDAFDCSLQLEAPAKKKSNNNNNKKNKNKKKKDVVGEEQEQEHEEAEPVELVTTLWPSFGGKKFPIFVAASFPVFAEERQDCLSAAAVVPVVVARVDVVAGRYDARRQDAEEQKAACPFLRAFSEPEVLSGRDKYFCGKCQRRHDASKQLLLGPKLPRVLVLHFKRFAVSLEGELRKIESPIAGLSERLDVRPFCAAANNNSIKNNDITDNNKALYSLCGVVEHMGSSLRSGHYVA